VPQSAFPAIRPNLCRRYNDVSNESPLHESQRLLREHEEHQAELEEGIHDSKKALARSDELLRRLKKILSGR
jgi:hypothetical protein